MSAPSKGLPVEERQVARSLLSALSPLLELRGDMNLQLVATFLLVALDEGKSKTEYMRRAGVERSTMSRHLLDLGEHTRRKDGEGLGLVTSRLHPESLREHQVYLTTRGRSLLHKMLRAWQLGVGGK